VTDKRNSAAAAGVIGGIHSATSPWKENRMYRSKLATMVAVVATAAGFSALAATADAQISGSIGGDYVGNDHGTAVGGPVFRANTLLTPVTIGADDR